jgi:putative tricarboxylic transport membrane protein
MVPLLTLGVPCNAVMALLFAALLIHGTPPGPLLIKNHPDLFWGVVISMFVGNGMLLALNLPLIGIWVQLLRIPYRILFPLIILFCLIGVYSVNSRVEEIGVMLFFGALGYLMKKYDYEGAPLILAFVLGPMMETNLRQSLIISKGGFDIFFTRPISLVCLATAFLLLIFPLIPFPWKKRHAPT